MKQFCTQREGYLGNVLLTSRNHLEYFYQCFNHGGLTTILECVFPNNNKIQPNKLKLPSPKGVKKDANGSHEIHGMNWVQPIIPSVILNKD